MSAALDALAPLPAPAGTDPQRVADAITAEARTSFATGMRVLAKPRRDAMRAIYAFARVIDDIADEDWPLAEKHRLLDDWCAEIGRLYDGRPVSAIGRALALPVVRLWDRRRPSPCPRSAAGTPYAAAYSAPPA